MQAGDFSVRAAWLLVLSTGVVAAAREPSSEPGQMPARFRAQLQRRSEPEVRPVQHLELEVDEVGPSPPVHHPRLPVPETIAADTDVCDLPACDACDAVACSGPWWFSVDFLGWWVRPMHSPPLVTQAPRGSGGALGQPGTEVIFGGNNLFNDMRDGVRLRLGHWFDECECCGIDGEYWTLIDEDFEFCDHGGGSDRTIARPFFDSLNNRQRSELVAFLPAVGQPLANSGALAGGIDVNLHSALQAASVHLRHALCRCDYGCDTTKWDLIGGYRFQRLDEWLSIREDLTSLDPSVPNTAFVVYDQFGAETRFHGFEIGLNWQRQRDRWTLDVLARLALGCNRQLVEISGFTIETNTQTGVPTTSAGGLLTQTTNIGRYERSVFSLLPELGVNLGYRVNDWLTARVGYDFLYWTNVVRPGDQIDVRVNPNFLPPAVPGGPNRPTFSFVDTGLWAQGFNLGIEAAW